MTPNEIQNKQFDKAMSGYRMDDVHAYLAEVAEFVGDLLEEKSELDQKLLVLAETVEQYREEIAEYREDEDSLRAALIGAQKLGDSVVRESKRKADQILQEAQQKADSMVAQIRQNIERETDTLNKMQGEVARFKSQILSIYRQHIESINAIPYDEKDFPKNKEPQSPARPAETKKTFEPQAVEPEPVSGDFVVTIEDDIEYEEIPDEVVSVKKESRHGNLLFGDKYPLTRNE